jgi:dUTP pyrophosphatase
MELIKSNFQIKLKIRRLSNNVQMPFYATEGAAGMDLTAGIKERMEFKPFERKLVPTGIIIELPPCYEAQIRPRSGLSIKFGMTLINCVGTIDEDYRGEVCVPMVNISSETYVIQSGERIAQMVISQVHKAEILETQELTETTRNSGGLGSTGI